MGLIDQRVSHRVGTQGTIASIILKEENNELLIKTRKKHKEVCSQIFHSTLSLRTSLFGRGFFKMPPWLKLGSDNIEVL